MLKRRNDWPERLAAFIRSRTDRPFEMRVNDCGLFACGAVDMMCGTRLAEELLAFEYQDGAGEQAALEQIAERYGIQRIPIRLARRGDIAIFSTTEGLTVMVVEGVRCWGPGGQGVKPLRTLDAIGAFRIG